MAVLGCGDGSFHTGYAAACHQNVLLNANTVVAHYLSVFAGFGVDHTEESAVLIHLLYASEAALQIDGVLSLVPSFAVALKEKAGVVHEGKGVRVVFGDTEQGSVSITVYPVVKYGMIIPESAWMIQERVKKDVERFTGLTVESVDVYVCGVEEVT